jgi:hypothetical protein
MYRNEKLGQGGVEFEDGSDGEDGGEFFEEEESQENHFNQNDNKKNVVVKPVNNEHYDIAYEMNEDSGDEENTNIGNMKKSQQSDRPDLGIHHAHNVDKLKGNEDEGK